MWENRNNERVPEKRGGAGQSLRGRKERRAGSSWNRLEQRTENMKDDDGGVAGRERVGWMSCDHLLLPGASPGLL